ncbi:MAG: hypothetical protein JRJ03_12710 [Deltaproteobacteria bacterium]|nr:hypothetical protein [Deltaproteobacteria bacterium]
MPGKPALKEHIEREGIQQVLEEIRRQGREASSFFSMGKISAAAWYGVNEADILIMGSRDPLKVKVEITHSWGQPILHLLLEDSWIQVLSFKDRSLYVGSLSPRALSKFFQVDIGPDIVWSVLRGYPTIREHKYLSPERDRVVLLDPRGVEVERIIFYPETLTPKWVSYRDNKLDVSFRGFRKEGGIFYAEEVVIRDMKKKLVIRNQKMVFNREMPREVFRMRIPPGFETRSLEAPTNNK